MANARSRRSLGCVLLSTFSEHARVLPGARTLTANSPPNALMRLSTVHLKDYKSYRGSVMVGPFSPNLSTIVGPNGAGKSTVIDGILFALGASGTEGSSVAINHACDSDECSVAVVLVGDGASPTRLTIQRRSRTPVVRARTHASVRASPHPAPTELHQDDSRRALKVRREGVPLRSR